MNAILRLVKGDFGVLHQVPPVSTFPPYVEADAVAGVSPLRVVDAGSEKHLTHCPQCGASNGLAVEQCWSCEADLPTVATETEATEARVAVDDVALAGIAPAIDAPAADISHVDVSPSSAAVPDTSVGQAEPVDAIASSTSLDIGPLLGTAGLALANVSRHGVPALRPTAYPSEAVRVSWTPPALFAPTARAAPPAWIWMAAVGLTVLIITIIAHDLLPQSEAEVRQFAPTRGAPEAKRADPTPVLSHGTGTGSTGAAIGDTTVGGSVSRADEALHAAELLTGPAPVMTAAPPVVGKLSAVATTPDKRKARRGKTQEATRAASREPQDAPFVATSRPAERPARPLPPVAAACTATIAALGLCG